MSELVKEQFWQCLIMLVSGMATMLVREIACFFQIEFEFTKIRKCISEILFWIIAGFIFSTFLYYCAKGSFEWHTLSSYALGIILWKKFFCDIIKPRR